MDKEFTGFTDKLGNKLYFGDTVYSDNNLKGCIVKHVAGSFVDEFITHTAAIDYQVAWPNANFEKLSDKVCKLITKEHDIKRPKKIPILQNIKGYKGQRLKRKVK